MEEIFNKDSLPLVDPITWSPFYKACMANGLPNGNVCMHVVFMNTMYGKASYFTQLGSQEESFKFLNSLLTNSVDFKDMRYRINHEIKDPLFIKELDGYLTVMFNNIATRVSNNKLKASSFLTDLDQMDDVMNSNSNADKIYSGWIIEALNIMRAMLTSCDADTLQLLSNDPRCLSYDVVADKENVIWLPFFTVETVIILNEQSDINSFNEFIVKDPFELKWTAPILDVLNNPNFNTYFKKTTCCRLIINDPYLATREYKLLYPGTSDKPYLFS